MKEKTFDVMKGEFVPYELALKLKELGFNEECLASYYHAGMKLDINGYIDHSEYTILAPLWQQAFNWFREKHKLEYWLSSSNDVTYYNIKEVGKVVYWDLKLIARKDYNTYEEARLECLRKLTQIVAQ